MAQEAYNTSLIHAPTWAVAVVCFVLVSLSILMEHALHLLTKFLEKRRRKPLIQALKAGKIDRPSTHFKNLHRKEHGKYLSSMQERHASSQKQGKISLVSINGVNQLHILIFLFAFIHVLSCIITLVLGKAKMKRSESWEKETKTSEYQFSNDPRRFRLTQQTSFGRKHLKFWSEHRILRLHWQLWLLDNLFFVCFLRLFIGFVSEVDYLTLRHGFIMLVLAVGTKLQHIITKMCLESSSESIVVRGRLLVKPSDHHFWFGRPRFLLQLIHLVLFQNSFQLAFFTYTWYKFGLQSCFHMEVEDIIIRIVLSILILVQILVGYVVLPLYGLVTQMGSFMKRVVFTVRVADGLKKWHAMARGI